MHNLQLYIPPWCYCWLPSQSSLPTDAALYSWTYIFCDLLANWRAQEYVKRCNVICHLSRTSVMQQVSLLMTRISFCGKTTGIFYWQVLNNFQCCYCLAFLQYRHVVVIVAAVSMDGGHCRVQSIVYGDLQLLIILWSSFANKVMGDWTWRHTTVHCYSSSTYTTTVLWLSRFCPGHIIRHRNVNHCYCVTNDVSWLKLKHYIRIEDII